MRRAPRARLGAVGTCLLVVTALAAAPSVAAPAAGGKRQPGRRLDGGLAAWLPGSQGDRDCDPLYPYGRGLRTRVRGGR